MFSYQTTFAVEYRLMAKTSSSALREAKKIPAPAGGREAGY
ncbi:MAG: hypothetical protein RR051_04715 [Clostridiales bacterium]